MKQHCPTCGLDYDYHVEQPECIQCQRKRIQHNDRVHWIIVNTFWTVALASVAATIVIVIWRSLPKW